jgi:rhodanese-related sulfurtransferase
MKTAAELIAEAKSRITEVTPAELQAERERGADFTLVDVREPNEWAMGHVPGAVLMPRGVLEASIESRVPARSTRGGLLRQRRRSALAADALQQMGYTDVASLRGGMREWVDAGLDVAG